VEEAARSLTLLMPDRFGSAESSIEALYASLNLLGLYHSKILMRPPNNATHMLYVSPPQHDNLSAKIRMFKMATHANTILAVIGNVQVLLEMLARQRDIRWPVILTVEVLKCICRLIIMKNNSSETSMLRAANASELNREILEGRLLSNTKVEAAAAASSVVNDNNIRDNNGRRASRAGSSTDFSELVELYKISGRGPNRHGNFSTIYKHSSSNNLPSADTSSTASFASSDAASELKKSIWSLDGLMEFAHVLRPVIYVLSILKYGYSSWIPFLISLLIDLVTLFRSMMKFQTFPAATRNPEINRRLVLLLVYLLRPPFFGNFSKIPIVKFCSLLEKIPGFGLLFSNILQLVFSLQSHFYYVNQY